MKGGCLYLFIITLLIHAGASAQEFPYQFRRLELRNGLSHNQVNTIYRDSKGFMWFGTMSGLNRFDGYDFKVFKHDLRDSTTLSDNYVERIYELPGRKLWIATRNGNNIYDPFTEKCSRKDQDYLAAMGLPPGVVGSVFKDRQNNFWYVYQNNGGVYRYNAATKKINAFQHDPLDSFSISTSDVAAIMQDSNNDMWMVHRNGMIDRLNGASYKVTFRSSRLKTFAGNNTQNYTLFIDRDNELWITIPLSGSPGGVFYYQPAADHLLHITKESGLPRLNNNIVTGVTQSGDGLIWIATDHGGINLLDKKSRTIGYLLNDAEDHTTISQNTIYAVYKDSSDVIWLGTYKQGICYYDNDLSLFSLFRHKVSDPNSLPYEDINRFAEDSKGNIWIGTNGGGLIYYDRKQNKFTNYRHNPLDPNSLSNDVIVSLCIDSEQKLWIGTYFGGLNCFDGKKFIHYRRNIADTNSISGDSIWEIFEDSDKDLWIGTLGAGLNLFNRKTKKFTCYRVEDGLSVHSNYISSLMEDEQKNIWIGASNGIDVLDKKTQTFRYIGHDDNDSSSLSNNNVFCVLKDSRGLIWIGTREGLNLLNEDGNTVTVFRREDGLADNTIFGIQEDSRHTLWMTTPNGLCNAVVIQSDTAPVKLKFVNYDESNGLQGREFNDKAFYKLKTGELIAGGPYGFNIFNPAKFVETSNPPVTVITGLHIFNRPVAVGEKINGNIILNQSITEAEQITLRYNENVFSISFSALGSMRSGKDRFIYTLEGFNKQWLTTDGRQRTVTYTNLDPGDYVFKVKSENDTDINGGQQLIITILPPFWKTGTAFVLYALLIVALLLLARRFTIQRANMRFQLEQQKKEAQRVHELDMLKLKFFTNVSHEFRTPLSLIITPVEKIMKQADDIGQKKQLQLVYRNAKRLLGLVNQLLDFRKLEMRELRLQTSLGNIVSFIRELTLSFTDLAEKKNIHFTFSTDTESAEIFFDPDKIERIMFNLLSNAFKFTPEKGTVTVQMHVKDNDHIPGIEIMVKDTGIGIPPEDQDKIFERFFQHELPQNVLNQGSGIGLAITREFIRLHGGNIRVKSAPGEGTAFTVWLPQKTAAPALHAELMEDQEIVMHTTEETDMEEAGGEKTGKRKGSVLVVDDNDDIRFYIKDNLRMNYTVYEAANGAEGWKKAQDFLPDIVISDIMMPEMNGVELCHKIKNNTHTSHIPVILLTARTAEEQKLEGFESGANDYITKPFSFEMLQSRIKNLLAHREAVRRLFQKQIEVQPKEIGVTPVDEAFIRRSIEVVESRISEAEFSVEDLSREMLMSRVALYKKLLSLTGKSPLDFIRTIRMKRAAQMMTKTQKSVSEIAYEVGFNNPKYFAKFFRKEFGMSPTEYIAAHRIKKV
ncbi:MAG: response regulator [Chitinophagaceae bacterium]|nr:response regulator [Chitinophagaceae bacterium]